MLTFRTRTLVYWAKVCLLYQISEFVLYLFHKLMNQYQTCLYLMHFSWWFQIWLWNSKMFDILWSSCCLLPPATWIMLKWLTWLMRQFWRVSIENVSIIKTHLIKKSIHLIFTNRLFMSKMSRTICFFWVLHNCEAWRSRSCFVKWKGADRRRPRLRWTDGITLVTGKSIYLQLLHHLSGSS